MFYFEYFTYFTEYDFNHGPGFTKFFSHLETFCSHTRGFSNCAETLLHKNCSAWLESEEHEAIKLINYRLEDMTNLDQSTAELFQVIVVLQ